MEGGREGVEGERKRGIRYEKHVDKESESV